MAVQSNDLNLSSILSDIDAGKVQLPDFQRDWVWDDEKICKLIESIASGFPMGAAMFLETGNPNVRFTYRPFTSVTLTSSVNPDKLVLDGQQRLTTLYQVLKSKAPAKTNGKGRRYYYLDIREALKPRQSMIEAVRSIPETKILTEKIGREVKYDVSTRELEYQELFFPLNIIFDSTEMLTWVMSCINQHPEHSQLLFEFKSKILDGIVGYKLPVITLSKDTSKDAVCQIFENVNTGGVKLTVFELITATFAADEFNLRDDWKSIAKSFIERNQILDVVSNTYFLMALTLLDSYKKLRAGEKDAVVTCKKRDVLALKLEDYKVNRDSIFRGFLKAADFLVHQGIYSSMDLPYSSQLIPLAAIFAYAEYAGINLSIQTNKEQLCRWYWCGVFGEQYGSANETRYSLDIVGFFNHLEGGDEPDTVVRANFQPGRLLTMQTRNSAAYKGVMALILQDSPLDFMSADKMDIAAYLDENTDIHHIFPQHYCSRRYDSSKWNSVINKSPIYASTNRSIGGRAPSEYLRTMSNKGLTEEQIREAVSSHKIDYDLLVADDFEQFFIDRAIRILDRIELAMGKTITGRDSAETIKFFGNSLLKQSI